MSDAIIGTGILLQAGDGATPENFVSIAQIVTLKPFQILRNEVDVSTHNAGKESKILGMLRSGQVTGTLNWLPTDATHSHATGGLLADIMANTFRNWRILLPPLGLPRYKFWAGVQLFDPQEVGLDSPMQIAFALTIDLATFEIEES